MLLGTEEEPFSPLDFTMLEEDIDAFVLEGLAAEVRETIWLPDQQEMAEDQMEVLVNTATIREKAREGLPAGLEQVSQSSLAAVKTPEPDKQELNVVEKVEKMKPLCLL